MRSSEAGGVAYGRRHGRGAQTNRSGRFEPIAYEPVDDGWETLGDLEVLQTEVQEVPARRIIPSIGKLDTASVVVMLLLEVLQLIIITLLGQMEFSIPFLLLFAVKKLLLTLLMTYFVLIIARVIISWVASHSSHPLIPLVYQLTEPALRPFSKLIPPIGGIDLSPLFALIALRFLMLLLGW